MKKWTLGLFISIIGLLALSACGSADKDVDDASAATTDGTGYEKTTIRLAYNLPQDHHIAIGIENFAKEVMEKSDGKVNVQVYPAGQS
ncbi:hypothetical protein QWT69_03555 [Sporosarcina oncorhynchi]|uniref:Uncharacterized protein n=1 Tax=Sporosarcina oncorhynchi TaxID=3056444 RepID=A0ABZ0L987_9BACL|nr:hypothetical protein [Sporosarcina sp. T2O-4]WOV88212.1 hypothetical protein QWT69_03555 [Sporosarcina sp. T2O-4]